MVHHGARYTLEGPRQAGDKAAATARSCPSRWGYSWLGAADADGCQGLPGRARASRPPATAALRGVQSSRGPRLCERSQGAPCGEPSLGGRGRELVCLRGLGPHFLHKCTPGDAVAMGGPHACHSGWSTDSAMQPGCSDWVGGSGREVRVLPMPCTWCLGGCSVPADPRAHRRARQGQTQCPHPQQPSGGWALGSVSGRRGAAYCLGVEVRLAQLTTIHPWFCPRLISSSGFQPSCGDQW